MERRWVKSEVGKLVVGEGRAPEANEEGMEEEVGDGGILGWGNTVLTSNKHKRDSC